MLRMKMSKASYQHILDTFKENESKIKEYVPKLKESGNYKNFDQRLTWDCMRAFIGTQTICDTYYNNEGLNDDHISTAGRKALKELNIL
jgi:hypothetical protein